MKITAQRKIAKSCLIALPLFKAITNHSSRYSWFVNWWEQRDLNPPQRISSGTAHVSGPGFQDATGRRSSWSSTSANPLVFIPVQLEPAILPSYTILPSVSTICSILSLSASTLSTSQFLLAPLPTLIASFFPSTGPSLHGEQVAHQHAIYDSIG